MVAPLCPFVCRGGKSEGVAAQTGSTTLLNCHRMVLRRCLTRRGDEGVGAPTVVVDDGVSIDGDAVAVACGADDATTSSGC